MVDKSSELWCWGQNNYGQLGLGDDSNRNLPTKVNAVDHVTKIGLGNYHSFLVDSNGNTMVMGYNIYGQLGLGDTTNRKTPTLLTRI